jgi:hypothetical protein
VFSDDRLRIFEGASHIHRKTALLHGLLKDLLQEAIAVDEKYAVVRHDGSVRFRLWATYARMVRARTG